ncbi:MAG: CorA family divalent cation transporter [Erysipelotrichaceae bacterium]
MFYRLDDNCTLINKEDIDPNQLCVGIISMEELNKYQTEFGFDSQTIKECENITVNKEELYANYGFVTIHVLKHDGSGHTNGCFYYKNNLLLVVAIDPDFETEFEAVLSRHEFIRFHLEKLIASFLEMFIKEDAIMLHEMESKIAIIEDDVMQEKNIDFHRSVYELRKTLLHLKSEYEQLMDISQGLYENDNHLFKEEEVHHFKILGDRLNRLYNQSQLLRDYIVQVHEEYQAQVDITMNKTMQVFTVITAIFLPPTLIVGWYGMNFKIMPELNWEYGYPAVITLCVVSVVGFMLYFKKKKLF